ncbi:DNA polymerase [Infectious spleen and kidney necrosis virus]|nr:DNA polymerase [Infectious spleen and kidney necrosis virus]
MDSVYIYQWLYANYEVRGYGIAPNNTVVCVRVPNFKQVVYVECTDPQQHDPRSTFTQHGFRVYETPRACSLYGAKGVGTYFAARVPNYNAMRDVQETQGPFKIHESRVSKTMEFTARAGLPTVGWIQVSQRCVVTRTVTMAAKEYMVPNWRTDVRPAPDMEGVPPAKIVYFDIEVKSDHENVFPSDRDDEVIFQIGLVLCSGNTVLRTDLLSLPGCDYDDSVYQYATEGELLHAFIAYIREHEVVAVCGYNIMGFDIPYIIKRCARTSMLGTLRRIGFDNRRLAIEKTAGVGHAKMTYIQWEGVLTIDLMPIIMMDHKLDSYSLDYVANHFVKAGKDPIRPRDIFHAYNTGMMARVGRYCVKDTQLCKQLVDYLNTWVALCEMAGVCNTSIMQLFTQGQQVRVFAQIYRDCTPMDVVDKVYVIPDGGCDSDVVSPSSYTGAYVYEPVPGVYKNVIPMDFQSLYPSIIISKNICYSTLVDQGGEEYAWQEHEGCEHDPQYAKQHALGIEIGVLQCNMAALPRRATQERARLRERIADMKIQYASMTPAAVKCNVFSFRFTHAHEGVLPRVLRNLLESRARIRARIKTTDDPDIRAVLDKRQLAYKISANSVYGTMGTQRGYLPFMAGAMTTTYCGRKLIEKAAHLLKTVVGATIVYGDTDSCYIQLGHDRASLDELWQMAVNASDTVSAFFERPVRLEFEQCIYTKFIIFTKKRYVYRAFTRDGKQRTGSKGVMLSRRDSAMCARNTYAAIMNTILEGSADVPFIAACMMHDMMIPGALQDDDFVLTKSVQDIGNGDDNNQGSYKVRNPQKAQAAATQRVAPDDAEGYAIALRQEMVKQMPAQAQLAERMRLQGRAVVSGARIEYVVLKHQYGVPEGALGARLLDFERWREMKVAYPLDRLYYMKSVVNACDQLLVTAGYGPVCSKVYAAHLQLAYVHKQLLRRTTPAV